MRSIFYPCLLAAMTMYGCATPVTMMKNDATGQVVHCGGGTTGSVVGGAIGYSIEKSRDEQCVKDHEAKGFKKTA